MSGSGVNSINQKLLQCYPKQRNHAQANASNKYWYFLYYRLPSLFPEFYKLMELQYCINPLPRVLKEKQAGGHCPLKILSTIFYISTSKKRL